MLRNPPGSIEVGEMWVVRQGWPSNISTSVGSYKSKYIQINGIISNNVFIQFLGYILRSS